MNTDMHKQLVLLQQLIDQINIRLDKMLTLTDAMSEALDLDETDKFSELLEKRQELMDSIDDLNRQVRKTRIAMDLDLEKNMPDQLESVLTKRQQLLSDIQQKDTVNREAALLRSEQYKTVLREVKNQRMVQTYEKDSIGSGSIFLDTKG
ncbi:MAG: hypothetical protein GX028_02190 [Clostridiaceae bacterium]|nr:hypothetical protein [Clostridiaceae bacterium]